MAEFSVATAVDEFRFMSKVVAADGHWLWQGSIQKNGYGRFHMGKQSNTIGAHRWAYEHWNGVIPEGMEIDHLCRVRHCVLPSHLETVTRQENVRRGRATKEACLRGHSYKGNDPAYVRHQGWRVCRVCAREAANKRSPR